LRFSPDFLRVRSDSLRLRHAQGCNPSGQLLLRNIYLMLAEMTLHAT
jgi:hypothetical protein